MIVRTAAEGASVPELERDVRLLEKLWEVTRGHAERAEAPALVYAEPDLSLQVIRDDLRADVSEVVVDDERQYHRDPGLRATAPRPSWPSASSCTAASAPLFQRYEIEQGIRSTLAPPRRRCRPAARSCSTTPRPSRSSTSTPGASPAEKRLEDTILKNNLEAAVEVVRQLRLRDVGGIIVIDFIDMASAEEPRRRAEDDPEGAREGSLQELRRRDLAARPGRDDPPQRRPTACARS